jgi:glycine cleavage system H protein
VAAGIPPPERGSGNKMNTPSDLRYSTEHEWVRLEGTTATVGITDYAQDALGDVVFVELPADDTKVAAGESCAEIESTKSVSEIYSPIAGRITEVNHALDEKPELVNSDPYGQGWIFRIEADDPAEIDALLDAAAYQALTA